MTANQQSSYLAQLHAAHKARQARIALAALKAAKQEQAKSKIIDVSEEGRAAAARERMFEKAKARKKAWEEERELNAKEKWRASWRYMVSIADARQRDNSQISLREILDQTAAKYGVTVHDIRSNRRTRGALMQARFEFCWRARNETFCSFPQIGIAVRRDHTTVIHAVESYEKARIEVMEGRLAYKPNSGKFVLHDLIITEPAK